MAAGSDYPDWTAPQAHADAVAATGVPLLGNPLGLYNDAGRVIVSGAPFTEILQTVRQIGYAGWLSVKFPVAATSPFLQVVFKWIDTVTSTTVATDTFIAPGNTAAGGFVTFLTGICKGDQVQVTLTNLDGAQSATVTFILNQDGITRQRDLCRSYNGVNTGTTVPGFTLATLPDDESCLGMASIAIPANSQTDVLFAMYNGPVALTYQMTTGAASTLSLALAAMPAASYLGNNPLGLYGPTPPNPVNFNGPRAPVRVRALNNSGLATAVTVALFADR